MNRRGNIQDVGPILWVVFFMAITSVVMLLIVGTVRTEFNADPDIDPTTKTLINKGESFLPGMFDFFGVLFLVGLPLISAVLAYFTPTHPLLFWMSLVLVVIMIMIAGGISVFWGEIKEDAEISGEASRLPMTDYILTNYGVYALFASMIVAYGTFVKLRQGVSF